MEVMENTRTELIPLKHAHVTQHTIGATKTDWTIRENKTEKTLGELPNKLNEKEVFAILNMMRKYESEAFNTGIEFGKKKYKNVFDPKMSQLQENNRRAGIENERLADALDRATKE